MAKKTSSKAEKLRFSTYKDGNIWKKNRIAKLQRHLKSHPEDAIAQEALANMSKVSKPRRAGYKARLASGSGTANRFVDMISRMLKGALKAASYNEKKNKKAKTV